MTIILNDASSSDEEEEQRLFTQPEGEAEAIDNLTAANTNKLDPPKRKAKSDPLKRKATPPGKTSKKKKKKKKHCGISDADLDAQLKQVSTKNADDSLLHAATEDNETKRVTKYFTMPVLGKKSSVWWEGFAQLMPSNHPKLFTEYVMCLVRSKSSNPDLGLVKIGLLTKVTYIFIRKMEHVSSFQLPVICHEWDMILQDKVICVCRFVGLDTAIPNDLVGG